MTEAQALMAKEPERTHVICREDGDGFVASWGDIEVRAGNPFGLDSELEKIGCPHPRNLYLVADE